MKKRISRNYSINNHSDFYLVPILHKSIYEFMHTYFQRIIVAMLILAFTQFAHAEPISVKVANLTDVASYPKRTAPATVISLNDSTISSEISAKVIAFPTRVGDIVEKNKTLVSLNCTDYELIKRQVESA